MNLVVPSTCKTVSHIIQLYDDWYKEGVKATTKKRKYWLETKSSLLDKWRMFEAVVLSRPDIPLGILKAFQDT